LTDDARILRLLTFRTASGSPAFDVGLRDDVLPELEEHRGLVDAYAGRRGSTETGERVVASLWVSRATMTHAIGDVPELERLRPLHAEQARDDRLEVLELAVGLRMERSAEPRLLRVFRGETVAGGLDAYVDEVHVGAMRDAQAFEGLIALYLATVPPASFVTVSAWADWESIESATGGSTKRPIATRHRDRIAAATAVHYEILPGTDVVRPRSAVDGDTSLTRSR
jgi:hypothetical protein